MGRLPKVLLGIVGSILAAGVILVIAANLWLQSSEVQKRLRQAVLEATGLPVKVQTTYFTPWRGISLSGIDIVDLDDEPDEFLHIDKIRLRIRLLPLFSRNLIVEEVVLEEPSLTWRQTPDGIWQVPRNQAPPTPPATRPESIVEASPESTPVIPELDASSEPAASPPPPQQQRTDFKVSVESIRAENASMAILNRLGDRIIEIRGLHSRSELRGEEAVGTVTARELRIGPSVTLSDIQGSFTFEDDALTLSPLTGRLAGGSAEAFVRLLPGFPEVPFEATLRVRDASIRDLLRDASLPAQDSGGTVSGDFELSGNALDDQTFRGFGSVQADQARFEPVDFLVQLGELLRMDELQLLELHDADARFTIADQQILIEAANLRSENIIIRGVGPISFQGDLELDGLMVVNEKLQNDLRGLLGDNFRASDEFPGSKELGFRVEGTVARPTTDLIEKITGFRIRGNMGGLIRQFLQVVPQQSGDSADPDSE